MDPLLKDLLPPAIRRLARRWAGRTLRFSSCPGGWDEAVRRSGGYSDPNIIDRVAEATRAVVAGRAVYERDSVLFHDSEFPFPVLAALLRAAALNGGRLHVIDFGGSLGSTYRQCRALLAGLAEVRWCVVEQPAFVDIGRREFSTDELSFASSIDELAGVPSGAVILASGVIQFLEKPHAMLERLTQLPASHFVIDRTCVSQSTEDRMSIQHVPAHVHIASYPCWIFSRSALHENLARDWRVLSDFTCADEATRTDDGLAFEFRGLIMERRA